MNVYKFRDTKEQDVGALLGISSMGIKVRNLVNTVIGEGSDRQTISVKYFTMEPQKVYPAQPSEFEQVTLVISGKGIFSNARDEFELEEGDIAHIHPGESLSIKNPGNALLRTLCFTGF